MLIFFEGHDLPSIPGLEIKTLKVDDRNEPVEQGGMTVVTTLSLRNDYSVSLTIPSLRFNVLVPNCLESQEPLTFAQAEIQMTHIPPNQVVDLRVTGSVQKLSKNMTGVCPKATVSPLDTVLVNYLGENSTAIYVQGAAHQKASTPGWMSDFIHDTMVRLSLPDQPFGSSVHNFSLKDVHFSLPNPLAEPSTPQANPRISALVEARASLPKGMNFDVDVNRVRAQADIYYQGSKLGKLDLHRWQKATTSRVGPEDKRDLIVQSKVHEAPLNITDNDVFTDLVQSLMFSTHGAKLDLHAKVDVNSKTALGEFVMRQLPAEGEIHVNSISNGAFQDLDPQILSLDIVDTAESSVSVGARAKITNPTEYSAKIPYLNVNILYNDTILGNVTTEDLHLVPGINRDLNATAVWNPSSSGEIGSHIGRNLISQYISGYNTTLTFRTHTGTIPAQPALGSALSRLQVTVRAPRLPTSDNDDGDGDGNGGGHDKSREEGTPHFILGATVLSAFLDVS